MAVGRFFTPTTISTPTYDEVDVYMSRIGSTNVNWFNYLRQFKAGCIEDGTWHKFLLVSPVLGGSSATHAVNLINPSNLQFFGSITHSAEGMAGNGANGYYATPIFMQLLSQNSNAVLIYSRTNIAQLSADISYRDNATLRAFSIYPREPDNLNYAASFSRFATIASLDSSGVQGFSRTNSANIIVQRRDIQDTLNIASNIVPSSTVSSGLANRVIGMANNINGTLIDFSTRQHSFILVSTGLTSSEMTSTKNRINTLMTQLGRNV
jgi:hypothetical protein